MRIVLRSKLVMSDDNKGLFDEASLPLMSFSSVLCGLVISNLDCRPKNTHQRDELNNIRASLKRLKQDFNKKNLEDLIQHVCSMLVATDEEETSLVVSSSSDLSDDTTMKYAAALLSRNAILSHNIHNHRVDQHHLKEGKMKSILKKGATNLSKKKVIHLDKNSQVTRTKKSILSNSNFVSPENGQFSSGLYHEPSRQRHEYSTSEINFDHLQKNEDPFNKKQFNREKAFHQKLKGGSSGKDLLEVLYSESEEDIKNNYPFQRKPTAFYHSNLSVNNKFINFEDFLAANSGVLQKVNSKKLSLPIQENMGTMRYTKKAAYRIPDVVVNSFISSKTPFKAEESQNDDEVISSLENVLHKLKQLNKNFK